MYYNGKLVNSGVYEWYRNYNQRTVFPPVLDVPQNLVQTFGCPNVLSMSLCNAITTFNLTYASTDETSSITALDLSKFSNTVITSIEFSTFPIDPVVATGTSITVIPEGIFSYLPKTGFKATASSRYSNSYYDSFRAFDNSTLYKWITDTTDNTPAWLEYISPIPFSISKYEITTVNSYITEQASEWTLSASNDGVTYDLIHTVSGHDPYTETSFKELFTLAATTAEYTHWKFDITAGSGAGRYGFGNINLTPAKTVATTDVLTDITYSDLAAGIGSSPTLGAISFVATAGSIDDASAIYTGTTANTLLHSTEDTVIQFDIENGVTCDIVALTPGYYTSEGIIEYTVEGSTDGTTYTTLYENLDFLPGAEEYYQLEGMFPKALYTNFRFRFKPRAGNSACKIKNISLYNSEG